MSIPREGVKVCDIDDIGVVEDIPEEPVTDVKFTAVSIRGVKNLEIFEGCYSCSGKVTVLSESFL